MRYVPTYVLPLGDASVYLFQTTEKSRFDWPAFPGTSIRVSRRESMIPGLETIGEQTCKWPSIANHLISS
jgi:hypothetical protein